MGPRVGEDELEVEGSMTPWVSEDELEGMAPCVARTNSREWHLECAKLTPQVGEDRLKVAEKNGNTSSRPGRVEWLHKLVRMRSSPGRKWLLELARRCSGDWL
ncbi:hypothetical protein MLD38_021304 [Melastoma candidum]|uniref:Uncharacterized protein n=1 Tax=Melastoma candidum TaxID=119954 RepID=A0ACB9QFY2_9MYRT|nr:hypothetical protein MLD38_021304 [Melastoma candidum]